MALNMADPAAVMAAYSSILEDYNNWLLLHYVNDAQNELGLHSFGSEGLEELKTKLADLDQVFFAFYHEEFDDNPGYIIINYIPPSISGVRRARALVHSRRLGVIFKKHQAIFTVDSLSLITAHNIHQAINDPDVAFPSVKDNISSNLSETSGSEATHDQVLPSSVPVRPLPPVRKLPPRPSVSGLSDATNKPLPEQRGTPSPDPARPLQPVRKPSTGPPLSIITDTSTIKKPLPEQRPTTPSDSPRPLQPVRKASQIAATPDDMVRRSFTATYAPDFRLPEIIPPVPPLPKGSSSLFSNLLRRKKPEDADLPPPTPPKDKLSHLIRPVTASNSLPAPAPPYSSVHRQRSQSMSEFAVISHVHGSDDLIVESDHDEPSQTVPLKGKWSHGSALPRDPEERARRRRELQLQREREEQEAVAQEAERQRLIKLEKEEAQRREMEEEARRKAEDEAELRRIAAERRRRERLEKEEEERRHREYEERKRLERERRMEEHRRAEEWRKEQARREQIALRQVEEARRKEEAERKNRIQQVATRVKTTKGEPNLSGWITVQSQDGLSWKRRFYKFIGTTVFLYRSPMDMANPLHKIDLLGKVQGLKEWKDGYEDLEAIAFSFVVEFKDSQPDHHWSMYADSEEEKYKVLGLFKFAAGL